MKRCVCMSLFRLQNKMAATHESIKRRCDRLGRAFSTVTGRMRCQSFFLRRLRHPFNVYIGHLKVFNAGGYPPTSSSRLVCLSNLVVVSTCLGTHSFDIPYDACIWLATGNGFFSSSSTAVHHFLAQTKTNQKKSKTRGFRFFTENYQSISIVLMNGEYLLNWFWIDARYLRWNFCWHI